MEKKLVDLFSRYDKGKQNITLIINIFVFSGFILEIITFHKLYLPLQFELQIFSAVIFLLTFLLLLIDRSRFYRISYLILTYYLTLNIVIYDVLFPEFIEKLHFTRSEFFSRNLFFILPLIAIVGFISSKRHIIIQGSMLLLYVVFQIIFNGDEFIKASAINYILTIIGFCWVFFFLVGSIQRFINELNETNVKLRETQQYLIHSEKMASLGVLSAGVAHEINNPLNFINGGINGIESYFESNLREHSEGVSPFIKAINTGVKRAADIVSSLSHYSRNEDLVLLNCDINSIIDNCLVMLQNEYKNKVEIIKNYTNLKYQIKAGEGKLHQAILNVISNSIHSIEKSGSIKITTDINENKIIILIEDTGCGISSENLKKIFDPFFTTKETGKGTGLGLSIAYNIIQEHSGTINYESELGKGTKAIIKLPIEIRS